MSDDSESVTVLADIPANCGMYTAQEVRDYVSGELADYDASVVSGALVELRSGVAELSGSMATESSVAGLIKTDYPTQYCGQLLLGSGEENLIGAKLHYNDGETSGWTDVLLEKDFPCAGGTLSGKDLIRFGASVAEQIDYYSNNGDYSGFVSGGYLGLQVYDELSNNVGGISGYGWSNFISTMQRIVSGLSLSGSGCGWDAFWLMVQGSYITMADVQDEMTDRLSEYVRDEDFCTKLSGCTDFTASLSGLTSAISGLNAQVSGLQSGIENMIDSLAESIVDTLTETASDPNQSEEVRAKAAAAKNNFDDQDIQAATILNAKKDVAGSIKNDIIGGLTEVANELDAPNTNDDVAGAASEMDGGGESAVEAQDTADNITKPGGVNDGLEGLADMLLGGAT